MKTSNCNFGNKTLKQKTKWKALLHIKWIKWKTEDQGLKTK